MVGFDLIAAESVDPSSEDGEVRRNGLERQSIHSVPTANGKDADAQTPQERRSVLRENAQTAPRLKSGPHAARDGQETREVQTRSGQLRHRSLRQTLPALGLFRPHHQRDQRPCQTTASSQFHASVHHSQFECLVQFYASYGWHSSLSPVQ